MFEFHGWATIQESTSEVDNGGLEDIIRKLKIFVDKLNWNSGMIDIRAINGSYNLSVSGYTNHKSHESEDIINLYKYLGEIAPGSYGLLYVKDDEDINGFNNEFIVYVLVRGKVNQNKDKFLSPFIPMVEDELID